MDKRCLKFLVDSMLGKLAKYLLILGFDTVYFSENDAAAFIKKAGQEGRVILSRNTKLKNSSVYPDFLFITDDQPSDQLRQVVYYFGIHCEGDRLFTRCIHCNQRLLAVHPEEIKNKIPPYILSIHPNFFLCPQCKKVYWSGTHLKKMEEILRKILGKKE